MKKVWILIILLCALPSMAFQDGDIYDREFLIIDNKIESEIEVKRLSQDNHLEWIKTKLYFHPVSDERLEVRNFRTTPQANKINDTLEFTWGTNDTDSVSYKVESKLKTKTVYDLIPNKVKFPIDAIPAELEKYLTQTESVDYYDQSIRLQANRLVAGEDDLYVVVNKLAIWIQENVEYNLSTVTADVSQKASWVMKNKYGVCDEITNLFLAMTRSLGIPARFVSGLAYTNSPLFPDKWGPHGWAEVWFPGYGWVPFDITYKQYGWLDPSHIKLRESLDAKDPSTRFEWRGRNVDLQVSPLSMTAEIKEKGPRLNYELEIIASPLKESVGLGSHNLIKAEVINYNNYYKTTDISLANTQGMTILTEPSRMVVLKPYAKEELFWKVKLDDDMDEEFVYTFPILVYNQRNISGSTEFGAKKGEPAYSGASIDQLKNTIDVPAKKIYTEEMQLSCSALLDQMFPKDQNYLNCTLSNKGNAELNGVQVCYKAECQLHNVLIGEKREVPLLVQDVNIGKNEEVIVANYNGKKSTEVVQITVLDAPSISIQDITIPDAVAYEDDFDIEFTLKKDSIVEPIDIIIEVDGAIYQKFELDELETNQKFVISTKGAYMKPGKNTVTINVLYYDAKYKRFEAEDQASFILVTPTFTQRMMIYVNRFGLWFNNFIDKHQDLLSE